MFQHPRAFRRFGAIAFAASMAACADQLPVAPTDAPVLSAGSPSYATAAVGTQSTSNSYPVLTRNVPLAADEITSAWVYPSKTAYQSVKLDKAGLKVSFAPGAVTSPLYVTLIAHKGRYITYEFLPHGTQFKADVKIQQDLHGTNAYQNESVMSTLVGGYLANGTDDVDYTSGTATFSETFPIYYWDGTTTFKKTTPSVAKFYTRHFSGYSLASNFSGGTDLYAY